MDEDEWPRRGETWRFCGANGFYGPEHMLVRVFPGKGRRALERLLLELVDDDIVLGELGEGYLIVRGRCEERVRAVERLLERYRRYGYGHGDYLRDDLLAHARWYGEEGLERTTVGTMPGMRECEDVLGPRRWMKREYRRRRRAKGAGSSA
ncbi:hypothetical protein ACFYUK_07660 [Nonomuraea wenchangensis]